MAKATKVTLVVPKHKMEQVFDADHAERLLAMRDNGGWELPKNSEFELDENGNIRRKENKK